MPSTKPRVVVTRKLPDAIETRMMELFDVQLNLDDKPMTKAQLIEAVAHLESHGIGFRSLTEAIDTTTAGGKLIFHIFFKLFDFGSKTKLRLL